MEYNKDFLDNYTTALFLLFLTIMGNYLATTLGCKTQYYIQNNPIVKNLVLFAVIYFTMTFTSKNIVNPLEQLYHSGVLWLCFIIFTKMDILFTVFSFSILLLLYIINNYKEYFKQEHHEDSEKKIKFVDQIEDIAETILIVSIILGFLVYFFKQIRDKGWNNFKYSKFFLGAPKCSSH
jgi:hypothetical protein